MIYAENTSSEPENSRARTRKNKPNDLAFQTHTKLLVLTISLYADFNLILDYCIYVWNKVSKNKAILKIFRFWWFCKLSATEKNIWKSKCEKNVKKYPIHMIQSAFESLSYELSNTPWIMMIGQKEKILDDFFKTIDLNFSLAW